MKDRGIPPPHYRLGHLRPESPRLLHGLLGLRHLAQRGGRCLRAALLRLRRERLLKLPLRVTLRGLRSLLGRCALLASRHRVGLFHQALCERQRLDRLAAAEADEVVDEDVYEHDEDDSNCVDSCVQNETQQVPVKKNGAKKKHKLILT